MSRILFFDGVCNLCNGFVDLLVRQKFQGKFAPLQGATAQEYLSEVDRESLSSVIYLRDGIRLTESAAVEQALLDCEGPLYFTGGILRVMPDRVGRWFYRQMAEKRYALFGKKDSCRLPKENEKEFFLP